MKKTLLFILTLAVSSVAFAQLGEDGFYRVKNYKTGRYITVIENHGSLNYRTNSADLSAIQTLKDFWRVKSNPASVIYFEKKGKGSYGDPMYDLSAQGTSIYEIIEHYVDIKKLGTTNFYYAYKKKEGVGEIYLNDRGNRADTSNINTNDSERRAWEIIPVTTDEDHFFGFQPQLKVGDHFYQTTYASFGMQFVSSNTKAYYVDLINGGLAVWRELVGPVPPTTPVIIESTSDQAEDNKVLPLRTTPSEVGNNKLKGVFFNCNIIDHVNRVAYNPQTMRILGQLSDGSIGFVKATNLDFIPANTAYLQVTSSAPNEIKLVTPEEYDGIEGIRQDAPSEQFDVYDLSGRLVKQNATSKTSLAKGIYVIQGKKVIIK